METTATLDKKIKKEIYIDSEGFNRKQADYNRKKQIEQNLRFLVKKITKQTTSAEFFKDIPANFYKAVEKGFEKSNPMKLKGQKLVMLLDIDTSEIFNLDRQYQSVRKAIEPSLTEFTVYAETQEQLNKYNACKEFIDAYKNLEPHIKLYPMNMIQGTSSAVKWNTRKNELEVNHRWIKGERF